MKKIVINACHGGYCLSESAYEKLGLEWDGFGFAYSIERDDPRLVSIVEELGIKAGGSYSDLKVVEIPDDITWHIEDYDGLEWVAEKHRTWA